MTEQDTKAALRARVAGLSPEKRQALLKAMGETSAADAKLSAVQKECRKKRPDSQMAFSLFFFSGDGTQNGNRKYDLLFKSADIADGSDIAAIWVPERHFVEFGGLFPNPSVLAAALAARTRTIGIRAGSVVLPLHHPVRVAEEWSVVDNISNGRVGLAFASGWHPKDFQIAPGGKDSHADRKDTMYRSIKAFQRLWRGEAVAFDDAEQPLVSLPRPLQENPPIWIASQGTEETFAQAGSIGAGVLTGLFNQTKDDLKRKIDVYRQAYRSAPETKGSGHVVVMLHSFQAENDDEVKATVREPLINYLGSFVKQKDNTDSVFADLNSDERQTILARMFDRYYGSSVLMGTVGRCEAVVEDMVDIGADEIGCLVDFGLPDQQVLDSLTHLKTLAASYR